MITPGRFLQIISEWFDRRHAFYLGRVQVVTWSVAKAHLGSTDVWRSYQSKQNPARRGLWTSIVVQNRLGKPTSKLLSTTDVQLRLRRLPQILLHILNLKMGTQGGRLRPCGMVD